MPKGNSINVKGIAPKKIVTTVREYTANTNNATNHAHKYPLSIPQAINQTAINGINNGQHTISQRPCSSSPAPCGDSAIAATIRAITTKNKELMRRHLATITTLGLGEPPL